MTVGPYLIQLTSFIPLHFSLCPFLLFRFALDYPRRAYLPVISSLRHWLDWLFVVISFIFGRTTLIICCFPFLNVIYCLVFLIGSLSLFSFSLFCTSLALRKVQYQFNPDPFQYRIPNWPVCSFTTWMMPMPHWRRIVQHPLYNLRCPIYTYIHSVFCSLPRTIDAFSLIMMSYLFCFFTEICQRKRNNNPIDPRVTLIWVGPSVPYIELSLPTPGAKKLAVATTTTTTQKERAYPINPEWMGPHVHLILMVGKKKAKQKELCGIPPSSQKNAIL